jgi:hypothetical protein
MSQDETDFLVTVVAFGTIIKASDYQRRWNSDVMMTGRVKSNYLEKISTSAFYAAVILYQVRQD